MIKMTIQDTEETAEFKVLEKPIIQKPLIAESDVVTIDNNLSTYVTGTQKRELTVGLGYLDSVGYETLRRIRDRQYAVLKYPTVTITADEPVDLGYGEDVPDYRQRLVQLKGKNLFDKSTETNYFIDSNGNLIAGSTWSLSDYIKISPNTTYIWHGEKTGALSGQVIWAGFNGSKAFISGQYAQINNTTAVLTTGNTTEYIRVGYRNDRLNNMQLEAGPIATTYEPYYNIELCKIGEYQDKIYKDGDTWKLYKATYKIVLNGVQNNAKFTERMTANNSKYRFRFTNSSALPANFTSGTVAPIYCDKLIGVTMGNTWNSVQGICYNDIGNSMIASIESLQTSTLEQANTWLGSNNLTVYYVLATPTTTTITNEALIAQLEALTESAFDRWTRVQTEAQSGSLTPNITVSQGTLSGTGTDVMLEGTTEDLLDFVILGDTFQQTYSGKNLLVATQTASQTKNGITITFDGASFTLNGTATASTDLYVHGSSWGDTTKFVALSAGTYTASIRKANMTLGANLGFKVYNNGSRIFDFNATSGQKTTTLSSDAGFTIFYISIASGVTFTNEKFYFQLEKSSSATDWQPYVGGVPSPNPDYPQEVKTVNSDITFDFSGPSGIKTYTMVGKMTLADQRIIDNCGTNEQVQVSFRESKQI